MASWTKKNGSDFESSNIDTIAYDGDTQILAVSFTSGGTYRYKGVDESTANNMLSADSKTKFLNESLKGRFEFDKT